MSASTRAALLEAALELFAEHGIDVPSMREISRTAGQGNTNALQYHFGDREELLRVLLETHGRLVDQDRQELLDALAPSTRSAVRPLADALVTPLARLLSAGANGRAYLQVTAEIVARPSRFAGMLELVTHRPSLVPWSALVEPILPAEAVGRPLHRRFTAIRFVHTELGSRARERGPRSDHRLFTSHLADLVAGLLTAPVSPETAALIRR